MPQTPRAAHQRPAARATRLLIGSAFTALAAALPMQTAQAADSAALEARLQQLVDRLQQLEQRNQALERQVQALSAAKPSQAATAGNWGAAPDARLQQVEHEQRALRQEVQALARPAEADDADEADGPTVEIGIVAVAQQINAGGAEAGHRESRLNYRGDVVVSWPLGSVAGAPGTAVGQLRFGQGGGVTPRPTYTGAVNSTTFEAAAGSDQTYAVVAQAYYQLGWALDGGRFNELPGNRFELSVGKMDLFGFFDQNAAAGDEGAQFLNNVFVHNPMLDSGGDIGADAYGFAPGLRAAYFNVGEQFGWGASLGVFASGAGAAFGGGLGRPLVIAQIETSPLQLNGEARGNYRLYAWTNGHTLDLQDKEQRHSGFGLSLDQRLGRDWNLFGRYGRRTSGDGGFDSALTLGFEFGGRGWGRGNDAIGLAAGWLKTGSAWRAATADGSLAGYAASGQERIAELYYRIKVNEQLEITPDFQLIQRAGGDGGAPDVRMLGVRASLGF
jgi:hypothetical protein